MLIFYSGLSGLEEIQECGFRGLPSFPCFKNVP